MTTVGLTYARGRADGATTEGGSPTREAGQFGSVHTSCPVRSSGPHRVRITVGSMFTAASGALVFFLDPDNAYNGAGQQANGLVFDWRTDANNRITLSYNKASTRWELERVQTGTGTNTVTLTDTFSAADAIALYAAWDASNVYLAVDGGAISSASNSRLPTLPATFDVGSQDGATASSYFNAAYGAVAAFSAPLSSTQWVRVSSLRSSRPPCIGEGATSSLATGMWYGAHSIVWTIPSSGAVLDLHDGTSIRTRNVLGAGHDPIQIRHIETALRDGSAFIDTRLRPRVLGVGLALAAADLAALYALRRTLMSSLNARRNASLGVIQFAPSTTVYELLALPSGGLGLPEASAPNVQLVDAVFLGPDPAWRVAARNEASLAVPLGGWSISWTIPWTITASAVSSAITNGGDLPSYPTATFTAGSSGCVGPSLANATTGETFRLAGLVLAAGEVLTIDMDARTATLNGDSVLGYRTSDSRMWALDPGSNSVTAEVESGSATVAFRHYTRLVGV